MRAFALVILLFGAACAREARQPGAWDFPTGTSKEGKSKLVTSRGNAGSNCPNYSPARNVEMTLVDAKGRVLATDVSGPDGSFVLWPEKREEYDADLFIVGGKARVLMPYRDRLESRECRTYNKCIIQMSIDVGCGEPKVIEAKGTTPPPVKPPPEEEPKATGKKPPSKLLPTGAY